MSTNNLRMGLTDLTNQFSTQSLSLAAPFGLLVQFRETQYASRSTNHVS
jgi:hypothetical protein